MRCITTVLLGVLLLGSAQAQPLELLPESELFWQPAMPTPRSMPDIACAAPVPDLSCSLLQAPLSRFPALPVLENEINVLLQQSGFQPVRLKHVELRLSIDQAHTYASRHQVNPSDIYLHVGIATLHGPRLVIFIDLYRQGRKLVHKFQPYLPPTSPVQGYIQTLNPT